MRNFVYALIKFKKICQVNAIESLRSGGADSAAQRSGLFTDAEIVSIMEDILCPPITTVSMTFFVRNSVYSSVRPIRG